MARFFGSHAESDRNFSKELALFSAEEKLILKQNFTELAQGQKNVQRNVLENSLLQILPVLFVEPMVRRLCDLMTGQMKGMQHITFEGYCHCAAVMVKGMLDEKAVQILYLASSRKSNGTREEFFEFLKLVVQIYLQLFARQQALQWTTGNISDEESVSRLVEAFVSELPCEPLPDSRYDSKAVQQWLSKCYQAAEMHDMICHRIFRLPYSSPSPFLPLCRGIPTRVYPSWLGIGDLIFINTALPLELRSEWRFLFSSRIHGESFSSLLGSIMGKGPSIIVIKDDKGHMFGGFAAASWTLNPHFTGTDKSFLFSLHPRMVMYPATGYNSHYQYLNTQQQTFPNGLGMGGQLDYFAFWIDAEYGRGKCAPSCTTFACPQLSASSEFKIDRLEVWAVGPEPMENEDEMEERPSILDSDVEGLAMLRMMNRGPLSEGLRENPTSDVPEDKSLPFQ